jgi:hypothetical protein
MSAPVGKEKIFFIFFSPGMADRFIVRPFRSLEIMLTFSVRHLNAIKSTAGRSFLGIKPLPALQQM